VIGHNIIALEAEPAWIKICLTDSIIKKQELSVNLKLQFVEVLFRCQSKKRGYATVYLDQQTSNFEIDWCIIFLCTRLHCLFYISMLRIVHISHKKWTFFLRWRPALKPHPFLSHSIWKYHQTSKIKEDQDYKSLCGCIWKRQCTSPRMATQGRNHQFASPDKVTGLFYVHRK